MQLIKVTFRREWNHAVRTRSEIISDPDNFIAYVPSRMTSFDDKEVRGEYNLLSGDLMIDQLDVGRIVKIRQSQRGLKEISTFWLEFNDYAHYLKIVFGATLCAL